MSSIKGRGAFGALAAVALIYSAAAAAAPAKQPAPAAKTASPKAAPAVRTAPAPRPAPRYTPPPPPPPANNALPMFEGAAYYGPGNFKLGDDSGHVSHGSSNFGFSGWGVVAQHLLIGVDYDHSSADFGVTLKIGRWRYGVGYIGPMGNTAAWYVKAFGATHQFDCDSPCSGTDQSGGGAGGGFIFPFAQHWLGQVEGSYTYLSSKDIDPSVNVFSFGGKVQYKVNRSVGLWAGINSDYYDDKDDTNSYITLVSGRFGVSFDVY